MNAPDTHRTWLSEAFLITFLTAAVYAGTYNFEAGYLRAFGLPDALATVTVERMFLPFITFVTFIMMLGTLADIIDSLFPRKLRWIDWRIVTSAIFLIFSAIIMAVAGFREHKIASAIFVLFTSTLFIAILWPLFKAKSFEVFFRYCRRRRYRRAKPVRTSPTGYVMRAFGKGPAFMLVMTMTMIIVVSTTGMVIGLTQRYFMVTDIDGKTFALIRKYGDETLLERVDFSRSGLYSVAFRLTKEYRIERGDAANRFFTGINLSPDFTGFGAFREAIAALPVQTPPSFKIFPNGELQFVPGGCEEPGCVKPILDK